MQAWFLDKTFKTTLQSDTTTESSGLTARQRKGILKKGLSVAPHQLEAVQRLCDTDSALSGATETKAFGLARSSVAKQN
jgi:hypothetical protein